MKRPALLLAALCAAPPLLAATAADLQRCRAIGDAAARLACYDALALPAASAAVPTGAAPAAPPADPAARFGLREPAPAVDAVESHIPGRFDGWDARTQIRLANGQVWQISDGSRGVYRLDSPRVRIRKGALGSFFLEIEGQNQSPRVRRVQ
ncbi:hypothetical protein [Azohydromonas sp.]|uniref:hypothetical protein n=1 Tax=Azohydromonas sp. TaxID=1872666 RepID=UPI002D0145E3|nr:hypothetical protein [Azohydromonas sp.]HMM86019.1 hypothetical protein [Azohydromonas sp.]